VRQGSSTRSGNTRRSRAGGVLEPVLGVLLLVASHASTLQAQANTGELRFTITDASGLGLKGTVELVSEANQYHENLTTDDQGHLEVKRLPYGIYQVSVSAEGFQTVAQRVEVRSPVPAELPFQLKLATVTTLITVNSAATLIDPHQAGASNEMGTQEIEDRVSSLPGRSLQDLVNDEPGWLYEGNAVLHPRASEYQTQFVIDGIPLIDNRSPGFGPEIEADDVDSMKVYTAGFPAEYGRKMGGVIEINTLRAAEPGLHGQVVLGGGSYGTGSAYTELQYTWKNNTLGVSATGSMTEHYLNPVVPQNYNNRGTTGSWAGSYETDLTPRDRLIFTVRHALARYEIPNELVQQNCPSNPNAPPPSDCPLIPDADGSGDMTQVPGGQRETSDNFETMGTVTYQHTFSSEAVGWLRGMVRDNHNDFYSNPLSWPLDISQHNDFKEIYFNSSLAIHVGRHDWKIGIESDNLFLRENFSYTMPYCPNGPYGPGGTANNITFSETIDPACPDNPDTVAIFIPGAPINFAFLGNRPDLEQSAYVQDTINLGNWTVAAGLRWDHYQLVVNQNAVSPRVSGSRYFHKANLLAHISYDRIFQTPSFENILLSSSTQVLLLLGSAQAPVLPSHGDYYEGGITKGFLDKLRLDANVYRRDTTNYPDDNQLLNTPLSLPIAFRKAVIYGAEAKIEVPHWWHFSGWASYSYQLGNNWWPETGGLFFAGLPTTGHFPDSQDQRNFLRARGVYQIIPRLWMALGVEFNSGLPFITNYSYAENVSLYGPALVDQLNFTRGRILPHWSENVSVGYDFYQKEERSLGLQADCNDLSNRMQVLDFGGLLSANAIGPARSCMVRVTAKF
jgi:Carboxypeptidase regulatory-like domain